MMFEPSKSFYMKKSAIRFRYYSFSDWNLTITPKLYVSISDSTIENIL